MSTIPASPDVVGLGAGCVDYVHIVPAGLRPFDPEAKLRIGRHRTSVGGQVATALGTCSRLGLRAAFVGALGSDACGARVREALIRCGVDVSGAVVRDAPGAFAVILVDEPSGERLVFWHRDDGLRLAPGDLPAAAIAAGRVLHVDDVDVDAAIAAAGIARAHGVPVTSDLDRAADRSDALIRAVTFPMFTEQVLPALTGTADPERALRKLRALNPGVLCVTLGRRGAAALDGDRFMVVEGFGVQAVDTTGAGDVFRGAFIYGLLQAWPLAERLAFANAAAAVACTRPGALDSAPTLDAIAAVRRR